MEEIQVTNTITLSIDGEKVQKKFKQSRSSIERDLNPGQNSENPSDQDMRFMSPSSRNRVNMLGTPSRRQQAERANQLDLNNRDGRVYQNTPTIGARYTCSQCNVVYRALSCLKRHTVEKHSIIGKYECAQCNRQFDRRYALDGHVCTGEKPKMSTSTMTKTEEIKSVKVTGDKIIEVALKNEAKIIIKRKRERSPENGGEQIRRQ